MSEITGGDLYHLWRVSEVHLPRIADVFHHARRTLNGAPAGPGGRDTDAFRENVPAYPGAAAMSSSVAAAWLDVRDELNAMYAQIGETVLVAAEGVRTAAQAYLDADLANADTLTNYLADPTNHDPNDPASNPPAPGTGGDPGDPGRP